MCNIRFGKKCKLVCEKVPEGIFHLHMVGVFFCVFIWMHMLEGKALSSFPLLSVLRTWDNMFPCSFYMGELLLFKPFNWSLNTRNEIRLRLTNCSLRVFTSVFLFRRSGSERHKMWHISELTGVLFTSCKKKIKNSFICLSSPLPLWTFFLAFYPINPLFNMKAWPSTQRQMKSVRLCRSAEISICFLKDVAWSKVQRAFLHGRSEQIERRLILLVSHKVFTTYFQINSSVLSHTHIYLQAIVLQQKKKKNAGQRPLKL